MQIRLIIGKIMVEALFSRCSRTAKILGIRTAQKRFLRNLTDVRVSYTISCSTAGAERKTTDPLSTRSPCSSIRRHPGSTPRTTDIGSMMTTSSASNPSIAIIHYRKHSTLFNEPCVITTFDVVASNVVSSETIRP